MSVLSTEKNELINKIAKSHGLAEYKVDIKSGSLKGDGYLGIIDTIDIKDERNPNNELRLIMKSAVAEEKVRETAPIRKAYDREIFMYETVFPLMRKLSNELGISNKFTETAKYYGSLSTEQQECLVLENLKEIDFKLWNRKLPMNADHVALVFSTYAKFHATGFALKLLQPEKFEELRGNLVHIFRKEDENGPNKEQEENAKVVFSNGFNAVANNEKLTKALLTFTKNFQTLFQKDEKKQDKYSTILHGDCWCNNMMFKYKDLVNSSIPTDICLLDWQLCHTGTPILDLSYFFYACCSKEVLYDLEKFLKIYHNSLHQTLEEAGLNPDEIFTYEELEEQWKIYSGYGLFMALLVMKVILGESEEAPDISELAKEGKGFVQSISGSKSVNMEMVNKRISDVIQFMYDQGYL